MLLSRKLCRIIAVGMFGSGILAMQTLSNGYAQWRRSPVPQQVSQDLYRAEFLYVLGDVFYASEPFGINRTLTKLERLAKKNRNPEQVVLKQRDLDRAFFSYVNRRLYVLKSKATNPEQAEPEDFVPTRLKPSTADELGQRVPTFRMTLEEAARLMIEEAPEKRRKRLQGYGPPELKQQVSLSRGKEVYGKYCVTCHGTQGNGPPPERNNNGKGLGPYNSRRPLLYLVVHPLEYYSVGGSTPEFAERAAFGRHATIPDMSSAAVISHEDWANLQAYIAHLKPLNEP